jgi:hypothetical protein
MLVRQGMDYRLEVPHIRVVGDGSYPLAAQRINTALCRDPGPPSSGFLIDGPSALLCWLSDHFGLEAELRLVRA